VCTVELFAVLVEQGQYLTGRQWAVVVDVFEHGADALELAVTDCHTTILYLLPH
jgi:hypothetical protein